MMLAEVNNIHKHNSEVIIHNILELYIMEINMKTEVAEAYILSDIQDCLEKMNIVSNYCVKNFKENTDTCIASNSCSTNKETAVLSYVDLNTCISNSSSDNFRCLNKSEKLLDGFECNISNQQSSHSKKTLTELNNYSLKKLHVLVEDLTQSVEQVSSTLVQLLLENDALQQESDARNIAIEQLLKLTVKVNENELKPIQMSIIVPDHE